ncbi:MAG: MgtC/SapB family protein [Ktedonobacteraceae bacterium]
MIISFPVIVLRLAVALLLGALIGFERETREHTAGMRTNALVALGAALFTIISAYGFLELLSVPHIQLDPTRIASYVIAGIGFLGGGAIFFVQDKERVKGLTTAGAIWVVAAIGMACGAGLLWEAVATTILALIVLILLRFVERFLLGNRPSSLFHIRIEATSVAGELIGQVYNACMHKGVIIERVGVRLEQEHETITLACRVKEASSITQAIGELRALPEVKMVEADVHDANRKDALNGGVEP